MLPVIICLILLATMALGCKSTKEYEALEAELASTQQEYDSLKTQMTLLQHDYDSMKAGLEAEIARHSSEISAAKNTISEANATISALNIAKSDLQSELDTTLDTEIKLFYTFKYQTWQFTWDLAIPIREYLYYKEKTRGTDSSKYTAMITDNHGDNLINILVQKIKDASVNYNLKKSDTVDLVGTFVQSLIHGNQDIATPYDNRALYPIETLFEQGGDCEDTSILAAALLQRLEYNQVFFAFNQPKHIALGIDVPMAPYFNGWEYQAKRFIYLETTGDNYPFGVAPSVYTTLQPEIIPLSK